MAEIKLTRQQLAKRCSMDIPNGSYVNLGIGIPTLVGSNMSSDKEVVFHCENGILGLGPEAKIGEEDPNLLDVSAQHVTLIEGGSFINHVESFEIVRGGHLDYCVMGALQISENGDLANWRTNNPDSIPGIGGAMDLAIGAKNVFIVMEHTTRYGDSKIVKECTFPLTAARIVKKIYTDLAVIDVTEEGLVLRELVPGMTIEEIKEITEAPLIIKENPIPLII